MSNVVDQLQQFAVSAILNSLLAALVFAIAIAGAAALLALFRTLPGPIATIASPAHHKLASLEALRGLLAFAVVAHHACCWYFFTQTGVWTTGNSVLFARLAPFGVAQFFYLSGFLFWRKLMAAGTISGVRFYLSRLLRIAPVYQVCIAAAILLGLLTREPGPHRSCGESLFSLLPWIMFSLGGQPPVLNVDVARITAGVSWTLGLEWLFYLALPFLAWFSRQSRRLVYLALIFIALHFVATRLPFGEFSNQGPLNSASNVLGAFSKFMLIGFGGGILIAAFESTLRKAFSRLDSRQNWLLLCLYLAYLCIPGISGPGQILLLAGFALVVQGTTLFGLLTSPAVRFLGRISYPVYLVHGMVFYAAMRLRGGIHPVSSVSYLAQTAVCLAVILLLATLIHLAVERPTMRISEKVAGKASLPSLKLPASS